MIASANMNAPETGIVGTRSINKSRPNVRETLQGKLKRWRRKQRITQDEARQHLDVTLGTYRNWEQGRKPPGSKMLLDAVLARIKQPIKVPSVSKRRSNGNRSKAKTNSTTSARGK